MHLKSITLQNLKATCEYILACAYYDNRNYMEALYHMQNFENLQKNLSMNQKKMMKLELLLIEWNCNASDHAIEAIQNIVMESRLITSIKKSLES